MALLPNVTNSPIVLGSLTGNVELRFTLLWVHEKFPQLDFLKNGQKEGNNRLMG